MSFEFLVLNMEILLEDSGKTDNLKDLRNFRNYKKNPKIPIVLEIFKILGKFKKIPWRSLITIT